MNLTARSFVLGVALLSATCLGQTAANPPEIGRRFVPPGRSDIVEDLDVPKGISVFELLEQVKRQVPEFQYVAVPGDWKSAPLPQMKLHNVSLHQVVDIVTNLVPTIRVATASDGVNSVYVFQNSPGGTTAAAQGHEMAAYGLADPVERLGLRDAYADLPKDQGAPTREQIATGRKKALQEILSLLESAAAQADASARPTLKLHEETEVLLVTGTRSQLDAVSQSLNALQSAEASSQYKLRYENLIQQIRASENNRVQIQWKLEALERENAALKDELRPAQSPADRLLKRRQQELGQTPTTGTSGDKH